MMARTLEPDHVTLARGGGGRLPAAPSSHPVVSRLRAHAGADCDTFVNTLRVRDMAARTGQTEGHRPARLCASRDWRLMAALMYGTGMRAMQCVRLRVQDIGFGQLMALNDKDRVGALAIPVPCPRSRARFGVQGWLDVP